MPSAYLIVLYNEIGDPRGLDQYAALAAPAIEKAGGTLVAKGVPARTYEAGRADFDSVEAAVALYESAEYRESLNVLGELNIRDVRIVAGM